MWVINEDPKHLVAAQVSAVWVEEELETGVSKFAVYGGPTNVQYPRIRLGLYDNFEQAERAYRYIAHCIRLKDEVCTLGE